MEYKIVKSKSQEKAKKSFNYQCRLASNCRHDRYVISCNGCKDKDTCDIQRLIKKARAEM